MTSRDFAYWLQGFFEISGDTTELNAKQVDMIKKHLNLVFYHEIDPSYTPDQKKQEEMNAIHNTESNFKPQKTNSNPFETHTTLVRC